MYNTKYRSTVKPVIINEKISTIFAQVISKPNRIPRLKSFLKFRFPLNGFDKKIITLIKKFFPMKQINETYKIAIRHGESLEYIVCSTDKNNMIILDRMLKELNNKFKDYLKNNTINIIKIYLFISEPINETEKIFYSKIQKTNIKKNLNIYFKLEHFKSILILKNFQENKKRRNFFFIYDKKLKLIYQKFMEEEITKKDESSENCDLLNNNHFIFENLNIFFEKFKDDDNGRHLLTGYFVLTKYEPCLLCGMSLMHSRVLEFYFLKNTEYGSFETDFFIHNKIFNGKFLNHKMKVIKILKDEKKIKLS